MDRPKEMAPRGIREPGGMDQAFHPGSLCNPRQPFTPRREDDGGVGAGECAWRHKTKGWLMRLAVTRRPRTVGRTEAWRFPDLVLTICGSLYSHFRRSIALVEL